MLSRVQWFFKISIFAIALALSANAVPLENRAADITGDVTYYDAGLGACGIQNTNSDFIAAVSTQYFDSFPGYNGVNPNSNPLCGRNIQVAYQGRTVTVAVTDRCGGCAYGDLDLTPTAFSQLADLSAGRLHGATWDLV
ncbi:RlpA-like double-psi beta-barrel-protein domain-containing protein-containing protein [Cyathus striatus]|nr:RlpA-like double-psi beta-barrel-protein domain-containing protein-containing protein [Cyathus striatus]KAF8985936.1 RlpA-like double-psi beta-barrel-protein domain-containing protein-containing protein [Cyathus striatus]